MPQIPTKRPLRAILGCAVSSPEQAEDEKQSLETQERLLRELATKEGWEVIDVLIIPGFSRRYYNWPEFAAAAGQSGIDAPARLLEHWQRGDFDVLAWRYGSRFAREQSIFGEVVARTIDQDARIFTLQDGWIDRTNYRLFIALGGYTAATEIDKLIQGRDEGMKKRAERGLRTGPTVIFSHLPVFDAKGKEIGKQVDESKRRLWDDVATLVLEGVSWNSFEVELLERFGHARADGRIYHNRTFYYLIYTPTFWGHTAWNYFRKRKNDQTQDSFWVLEEGHEIPDGTTIYYNTHEPVYTGEQAARIISELKRRQTFGHGHSSPRRTHPFSGLIRCGECGYYWIYLRTSTDYECYRCVSHYNQALYPERPDCSQRRSMSLEVIQEWMNGWLTPALENPRIETLFRPQKPDNRAAQLASEIETAANHLRGLLHQRADAEGSAARMLSEEIRRASEHIDQLETLLKEAQSQDYSLAKIESSQQRALVRLASMGLPSFWRQESRAIHQLLADLFGGWRMIALDQEIIGIAYRPNKTR